METEKTVIGVIGLGYVGLSTACMFARKYRVVGYDINSRRIEELQAGNDRNLMKESAELKKALADKLTLTNRKDDLRECNFYVVTLPTPVDDHHKPDTTFIEMGSRIIGEVISKGDIAVFESTVHPGATDEICLPIIEKVSGLKLNEDFFGGYSPERVNPGDTIHIVEKVTKITSGSTPEAAMKIDAIYNSVLENGTCLASSIRVAEGAKILENSQRDMNIAFMNEMAMVFNQMGVDFEEVARAAGTKWNFLPFSAGLVGGHCIGVDSYYLIAAAKRHGLEARLLEEARRVNESVASFVADRVKILADREGIAKKNPSVLMLGITFKENCTDWRNTKVLDIYEKLSQMTNDITICDTWVDAAEIKSHAGLDIVSHPDALAGRRFDIILLCVKHDEFLKIDLRSLMNTPCVVYDVKGVLPKEIVTERL